jgi:hypothetical protein
VGDDALSGSAFERYRGEVEALERSKGRKRGLLLDRVALDPDLRVATAARSPAPRTVRSRIDTGGDDLRERAAPAAGRRRARRPGREDKRLGPNVSDPSGESGYGHASGWSSSHPPGASSA